jgi:hypothetical protein
MENATTALGRITKCTGRGSSSGQMGDTTTGNIKMTRSMVMACLAGKMANVMRVNGQMGSRMELDGLPLDQGRSRRKVFGLTGSELSG